MDFTYAPIAGHERLWRIAGGSETDVYRTGGTVIKVKPQHTRRRGRALRQARRLRAVAEQFVNYLGARHSIRSEYVVAQDAAGELLVLIVQPFVGNAQQLARVAYTELPAGERAELALQLREIVRQALLCFRDTSHLPDLHGSFSRSTAERLQLNVPLTWPRRVWDFVMTHSLLRAHNLLLTNAPDRRVVLVDYDPVRWAGLLGRLYDVVRWMLLWRDQAAVYRLWRTSSRALHTEKQLYG